MSHRLLSVGVLFVVTRVPALADLRVCDSVLIGTQRYIRTIQEPGGFGACIDGSISAHEGTAALAFQYPLDQQSLHGFVVHYDQYGRRTHEPMLIDPVEGYRPRALRARHYSGRTALVWHSTLSSRTVFMKLADSGGALQSVLVTIQQGRDILIGNYDFVAHDGQWYVLTFGRYLGSMPSYAWIAVLDEVGQRTEPDAEYPMFTTNVPRPHLAILGGDTCVLGLSANVSLAATRARVQTADGASVWTDAGTTWNTGVFGLCQRLDNTLSALYGVEDYGAAWLLHLSSAMQPLDEPTPVAFAPLSAAFRSNGDFAVLARPSGNQIRLHLYDVNGQPTASPFNFVAGTTSPYHDTAFVKDSLSYEDDGTIWICWNAWGGPDASNYLCILKPYTPGDCNLDGRINNFDIDAFVLALTDVALYEARYNIPPDVGRILGDVNFDGALNNFDIDPFVQLLGAQP